MEKYLLIRSLRHWCDLIWEYNSSIDKIYVHCDKLIAKIENNWFDTAELAQILRQDLHFEISRSDERISAEYMQRIVESKVREEEFQLWFYHNRGNLMWYNIRVEKMSHTSWLITGQNMFDEINERSIYKSQRDSFDFIMSLDVLTGKYIVTLQNTPLSDQIKEFDYGESVANYVRRHVVDDNAAQILHAMQLETVVKNLEQQDKYSVFFTVRDHNDTISYKRLVYSYYDNNRRQITLCMLDISSIVRRYENKLLAIQRENSIDALTGVYNRNYYEKNVQGTHFSGFVAMIDMDDLKRCNDTFGHKAGDAALKKIAAIIRRVARPEDRVIRFGGDEFLLLMENCSEAQFEDALLKIQKRASTASVSGFEGLRLSVSIGGIRANGLSSRDAVMRADRMMYTAKTRKNLVVTDHLAIRDEENRSEQFDTNEIRQQVLIADGSKANRSMLQEMLKDDFRILDAENGAECMRLVKELGSGISLILLDIHMPEMDGFEVLREMSRLGYLDDIPVIMISESDTPADIRKAYSLGAMDYIHRPLTSQMVYRRVSNTIMLKAKQRRLTEMVNNQILATTKQQQLMVDFLSRIVGYRSGESNPHFANMSRISTLLLKALKKRTNQYHLTDADCELISTAAVFHDVGKIGISEDILHKPDKLTAEEFEIMKTHTVIGEHLIKSMEIYKDEPLLKMSAQICRWHHEKYDGGGYPDGLKGEEIPICAQVISLADVYDALVSERSYKPAYTGQRAIEMILNGECGAFNPILIDCLLDIQQQLLQEYEEKEQI